MKQINKQAGFTLIELIMVIVILGVLSAFALPRFADLGGDAREASIQGLAGSIKSAANIAHAKALVDGGAENADVTLEGLAIKMSNFYPTAADDGINAAAQVDSSTAGTDTDYKVTYDAAATPPTATYTIDGAKTPANCQVVYSAATATAIATTVATVTGC